MIDLVLVAVRRWMPPRLVIVALLLALGPLASVAASPPRSVADPVGHAEVVSRWVQVPIPVAGRVSDIVYDAEGRAYAMSRGGVLSRYVDDLGWRTLSLDGRADTFEHPPRMVTKGDTLLVETDFGVQRSDDLGETWRLEGRRLGRVDSIAVDPHVPERWSFEFVDRTEVSVTEDDGLTWTLRTLEAVDGGSASIVATTVAPDGDLFALLGPPSGCGNPRPCDPGGGVYRSVDGGLTWVSRSNAKGAQSGILASAPDGMLFAQLVQGFARSADDGETWQLLESPTEVRDLAVSGNRLVAIDRTTGIHLSADGGATWNLAPEPLAGRRPESIAADPTAPGTYLVAVDSTTTPILRTVDGAATWEPFVQGLNGASVESVAVDPSSADHVVVATMEALVVTEDGGRRWSVARQLEAGRLTDVVFAPSSGGARLYATVILEEALLRSDDGGRSWTTLDGLPAGADELAVGLDDPDLVLAASNVASVSSWGVHRSADGGMTWSRTLDRPIHQLAMDPRAPDVFYAVGSGVFRSDDRGLTWVALDDDSQRVDVGAGGLYGVRRFLPSELRRSDDRGETWTVLPEPPTRLIDTRALVAADDDPDLLLMGFDDGGVLESRDGGTTWNRLAGDLGRPVSELAIAPDGTLWAGTLGSGLLRGEIVDPPLVLQGGRFEAEASWRTFTGATGTARATLRTDDTGTFWFFGPDNLELMVKVLDGREVNGHWWVYYGALSNVELTLTVVDTRTGARRTYFNPLGEFASAGDVHAFPEESLLPSDTPATDPPTAGPPSMSLGDRFVATVTWRDFEGIEGEGSAVPLEGADDTGAFWFFDPRNLEMMVKVLDGRAINGKFWVFFGSLSNVEFTLRLEDTVSGAVREYVNPLGSFASRGDVDAFDG